MKYIIVKSKGSNDSDEMQSLEVEVQQKIDEGWYPQGGIAVRTGSVRGVYFLQAMVKE